MMDKMLSGIRSKSRDQWIDVFKDQGVSLRVWIQEHPELTAAIAFLLGIIAVLFQRFVFGVLFLAAIAIVLLLIIAPAELVSESGSTSVNSSGSDKANGAPPESHS